MEIGKIKWAGHYNSRTGEYNEYGFIVNIADGKELYFHKKKVKKGSKLLERFDSSDNTYVVYQIMQNKNAAIDVHFINEEPLQQLDKELPSETRRSLLAHRDDILKVYPEIVLGNDPKAYYPLLSMPTVLNAFISHCDDGWFSKNTTIALIEYFEQMQYPDWNESDWQLIDWQKEPITVQQKLCIASTSAGISIAPLLTEQPSLWNHIKSNSDYIQSLSYGTFFPIVELVNKKVLPYDVNFLKQSFLYSKDERIREFCYRYLLIMLEKPEVNWDSDDQEYCKLILNKYRFFQSIPDDRIINSVVAQIEKAWITEDSHWWSILSDSTKKKVLDDYKKAGLITVSNATVNSSLEEFLEKYYSGAQKRDFSVQQKEAIQAVNGVTLLFAVPGSGKTTVIVARAGYMIHAMGIVPAKHLIMTYNRAAAEEMKSRYKAVFANDRDNIPEFCTIHSFCRKVVSSLESVGESFPLLLKSPDDDKDPQKKQKREKQIVTSICGHVPAQSELQPMLQAIAAIKQKRITTDEATNISWYHGITLKEAWNAWQRKDVTQKDILRKILKTKPYDEEANTLIGNISSLLGFISNRMLSIDEIRKITYAKGKQSCSIEPIYLEYQEYLRKENLMDFDDMLSRAYQGLKKHPEILRIFQDKYPYVSLDEAQDTSRLQHEITALLVQKRGNLFMVGDDDQSIYAFRGAAPSEMLDFQKRYPQGRKLLMGMNYRSTINIVRSADRFVRLNQRRESKLMRSYNRTQGSIQLVLLPIQSAQYEYIFEAALTYQAGKRKNKNDDLAILYRENVSAFPIMAYFYRHGIAFTCRKQKEAIDSVLDKQEIRRIIKALRYYVNPSITTFMDAYFVCYPKTRFSTEDVAQIEKIVNSRRIAVCEAALQYLNTQKDKRRADNYVKEQQNVESMSKKPTRTAIINIVNTDDNKVVDQNGDRSISAWMRVYALLSSAEIFDNIPDFLEMLEAMRKNDSWHEKNRNVTLSTMHSAKGAEFGKVIIIDAIDDMIPGSAKGNDAWYDAEEERRLFYVAMTRAKRELDILQVDVYQDRHHVPSRFIRDVYIANPNVRVIDYHGNNKESKYRVAMSHYVVRHGENARIYSTKEEIDEILKKDSHLNYVEKPNYYDALVFMRKGDRALQQFTIETPADLPSLLTKRIWGMFGVSSIDELSDSQCRSIAEKANLFMTTGVTDYSDCVKEYALMYLPVNVFKIWKPLNAMVSTNRLPVDGKIKILEIGPGPGTSTLGILMFYAELAKRNPQKQFCIEYYAIEREQAFIDVWKWMVADNQQKNFSVKLNVPQCADAIKALKQYAGKEMDLVIESNMINPNEHIHENQLIELVGDICKALRNYGSFIMIEPEGSKMEAFHQKIVQEANKTDSILVESSSSEYASVDLQEMRIVRDVIAKGLRKKDIGAHGFSYAILERRNMEVRSK